MPDTCISQIPVHQVNCIQGRVGELATSEGIRHGFQAERDPGPILDLLRARQVRVGRSSYSASTPPSRLKSGP